MTIGAHDLPGARAVPRDGDAEPDRVRGHLPAARGAGRPLHAQDPDRLPGARRGADDRPAPARRAARAARGALARRPARAPGAPCSSVYVDPALVSYAVALAAATREPGGGTASPSSTDYIAFGASPRGPISLDAGGAGARAPARPRLRARRRRAARSRRTCCATGSCSATRRSPRSVTPDAILDRVLAAVPVPEVEPRAAERGMNVGPLARERRRPSGPGPGPLPDRAAARARRSTSAAGSRACSPATTARRTTATAPSSRRCGRTTPGDDVRRIDWNVTARTGEPHVRVHLAERVLVTWLVLDTSPSMQFGTADRRKADVADGVALAIGHVATRRGNRLGVAHLRRRATRRRCRPRQGRVGLIGLLAALQREPEDEHVGATSLGDALARTGGDRAPARRSSSSSPTSAARSTGASRCSS